MTRNRRAGAGTNAPTGVAPAAASTTTTASAGAFFVGPSFHALRVCSVLSLVLVRVCPILRCVVRFGQSSWLYEGRRENVRGQRPCLRLWAVRGGAVLWMRWWKALCARACAMSLLRLPPLVLDPSRTRPPDRARGIPVDAREITREFSRKSSGCERTRSPRATSCRALRTSAADISSFAGSSESAISTSSSAPSSSLRFCPSPSSSSSLSPPSRSCVRSRLGSSSSSCNSWSRSKCANSSASSRSAIWYVAWNDAVAGLRASASSVSPSTRRFFARRCLRARASSSSSSSDSSEPRSPPAPPRRRVRLLPATTSCTSFSRRVSSSAWCSLYHNARLVYINSRELCTRGGEHSHVFLDDLCLC